MVANIKLFNISGTVSGFTGSHALNIALMCGVSGTQIVPIRVTDNGTILTSGIN